MTKQFIKVGKVHSIILLVGHTDVLKEYLMSSLLLTTVSYRTMLRKEKRTPKTIAM
jgi:hypothetical protein